MKSYLELVTRYLSAHKRKTRLVVMSIALSVALVTGIFSMLDLFLKFEKIQVIHDIGDYHLMLKGASESEMSVIGSRIDVEASGRWYDIGSGSINGTSCKLGILEEAVAKNLNARVVTGRFPSNPNEVLVEKWTTLKQNLDLKLNDSIKVIFPGNIERECKITGIIDDLSNMKAAAVPAVIFSYAGNGTDAVESLRSLYIVKFKNGIDVNEAAKSIKAELKIDESRMGLNQRLLATMGQSTHNSVVGLYTTGAILFFIVMVAGIVMIYNTFNISVMERVRHFGLLRCIGASREQIKKLVRREGWKLTLIAIPLGIVAGLLLSLACAAVLKFYNKNLFGSIPLFSFSILAIGAGIAVGFLTVFAATLLPARKASRISPVNAVTGSNDIKTGKIRKQGFLTKNFRVEFAMGLSNAFAKKKTLILMSCSIAISIVMFLGFNVFVEFMHSSLKTTKPYTPDISLVSEEGLDKELMGKLSGLDGIDKVYGRMFSYVNASFDFSRLTDIYKANMKNIKVKEDGTFIPPETSWLISYDKKQLKWAGEYLLEGELSEDILNEQNGIIAVAMTTRKNITSQTTSLELGDKVSIQTAEGEKVLTVMAVLRNLPFNDSKLNLTTFITTEKIFSGLFGESAFKIIEIQLKNTANEQVVDEIRNLAGKTVSFRDQRQKNQEVDQTFLTMAVFIYGFVLVIVLISILNIINTMNTSVASRTRYFGVMRAVGMTGGQLDKMVLSEASAYGFTGCIAGCILGVLLQRFLIFNMLSSVRINWKFPLTQLILILALVMLFTVISIISPLKRIKSRGISEVVNSL